MLMNRFLTWYSSMSWLFLTAFGATISWEAMQMDASRRQ